MDDHPFKCIRCASTALEPGEAEYRCRSCSHSYPVAFGVPLFVRSLRVTPSDCDVSPETAAEVCRVHGFPSDDASVRTLRQILSHNYHLEDLSLAAENNYFLHRVRVNGRRTARPHAGHDHLPVNEDVRYRVVGHLLPDALPAGRVLSRNVRVQNTGASVISSKSPHPVYLSYHWRTPAGEVVEFDGERTVFPIDLAPGRTITVPAMIRTPASPGPYMLELTMVREGVAWLDGDATSAGVDVVPDTGAATPSHWEAAGKPAGGYTYEDDHRRARDILCAEVGRRHRPGMRLLELGGCCSPMARGLDADVYSVDIDVQTLQVGQLSVAPGERLRFVCADAHHLPFADHTFDGVVVFSALHHFAAPHEVLARLKPLLRPGAFLAIMCEPVGFYRDGVVSEEFIDELAQGINEQIFTLDEYHHMFRRAGLYTTWAKDEGGSFKAVLQAKPAA